MTVKFKLELDVVLDDAGQAKLIDLARQFYALQGATTTLNGPGPVGRLSAEKFLAGPEDALMELLERNPLLTEAGVDIERVSCRSAPASAEAEESAAYGDSESSHPCHTEEEDDAGEDNLDEFESGLYLCRWPNGEFSVVKADSRREALVALDEWAGASPAWLIPLEAWMVDFRLNDCGEIELADLGEETEDLIWDRCYPELDAALSHNDVLHRGDERTQEAAEKIRRAVERERKRLWGVQWDSTPAKTEMGRELQKRLGTVGPVADHYVEVAANEILRGKAGEKGKPS